MLDALFCIRQLHLAGDSHETPSILLLIIYVLENRQQACLCYAVVSTLMCTLFVQ